MATPSLIPAGDFRTSYAADTTIFPTTTSRNMAIAGIVLICFAPLVLGGIIIGLLENVAQYIDSEYLHWGNLYEVAPFYVLIIILMIKPYGLFGTKDIERV